MNSQEITVTWQALLENGCTISLDEHDTEETSRCVIREIQTGNTYEGESKRWEDAFEIAYGKYKASH